MKYKLIAADMDGTLLDDQKIITPRNLTAIKNAIADGAIFAFSTGRPPHAVASYREIINKNAPVIAYNGARVILGENNIFFNQTLTAEQARIILKYVEKYDTMACIWSNNRLYVTELGITVCPSTSEYLEFFSSTVSKALSLERLAKHFGIKREEIIAFGDNFNDLEMIEYAGLGVAMANAPEGVRAAADFVTVSNNEDGIAYALEKFL